MIDFETLNARVIKAQEAKDNTALVAIYSDVGRKELDAGREEESAFLLTQAYVYALEGGLDEAKEIHGILMSLGREE